MCGYRSVVIVEFVSKSSEMGRGWGSWPETERVAGGEEGLGRTMVRLDDYLLPLVECLQ
ncbi:hypothetical protein Hanom_Chr04g00362641 [Helianthus anomalus]